MRPNEGFRPNTPQNAAGSRAEPAASVAIASGASPAATAAAAPPLEPPGVNARFHGLRVMPKSGQSVSAFQPSSDVEVLPTRSAPAANARCTTGALACGTQSSNIAEPRVVLTPAVAMRSFTEIGRP